MMQTQTNYWNSSLPIMVSFLSLFIAIVSVFLNRKSWKESNRPLITVRVTSFDSGGNKGTPLNLIVENTGNRPAKNIRLSVNPDDLKNALVDKPDEHFRKEAENCFSERGTIPVLANGKSATTGFGWLSADEQASWKELVRFDTKVTYEDLDGRKFESIIPLYIADDLGFAGTHWGNPKEI